ncbi:MAG: hypothetical protein LBN22_06885 [Clostridiales Family XIII bacterium]|jgi:hypothetical protein|nr:hypothetical protein [Clostridiales Family XIII bacterium]
MQNKTVSIAINGLFLALSMIALFLASVVPLLETTFMTVAAVPILLIYHRMGKFSGLLYYIATLLLGLLIIPNKTAILMYFCVMGPYVVIKPFVEKIARRSKKAASKATHTKESHVSSDSPVASNFDFPDKDISYKSAGRTEQNQKAHKRIGIDDIVSPRSIKGIIVYILKFAVAAILFLIFAKMFEASFASFDFSDIHIKGVPILATTIAGYSLYMILADIFITLLSGIIEHNLSKGVRR